MNLSNPFKKLTHFELALWFTSVIVTAISFLVSGGGDILTLIASLIGVTALIFLAKGYVIGQVLCIIFAIFYGIISFYFKYYGEMLTYLCMTAPPAFASLISWIRHPYKDSEEVEVSRVTKKHKVLLVVYTILVTVIFYFILSALDNANLLFSVISVSTSFVASYLTYLRSPYYALGYAANDVVLIILWVQASIEDISYMPMTMCFVMFLLNDIYGFYNWKRMQSCQSADI